MKNIIINTAIAPIIGVTRNPHLDFTTIIIIINVIIIIIGHFKQSFSSCVYKKKQKNLIRYFSISEKYAKN